MEKITVNASRKYDILVGEGILSNVGKLTGEIKQCGKIAVISDDTVYEFYGEKVKRDFENNGFKVSVFVFPHGEESKNMRTIMEILEFLAKKKITRNDLLVALGGGVTGDITGFAASVYLRGIDYLQIPTTLLAAVDSSVGGKTGVDLNAGKNLAGAFHQPVRVICDVRTFDTLPREVFADGISEAVKYGLIRDRELFMKLLEGDINADITDIVMRCVSIKKEIVEADEFDRGERQLLNFGHTAGHAIELLSGYKISHGRAVAIGMDIIAGACDNMGLTGEPCRERLASVLKKYNIDTKCVYSPGVIAEKAMSDKKRGGGYITLVLIEKIGKAYLKKISVNDLENFMSNAWQSL